MMSYSVKGNGKIEERLNYFDQIINITFTFLFYFLFSNLFDFYESHFVSRNNAG